MDRDAMVKAAETAAYRQDIADVDGIVELFAEDCTFMMPVLAEPIRGREALREHVAHFWPKSATSTEWIAAEGNRLVCAWNWRAEGSPEDTPLLRGVSIYLFNDDGLIQDYEDFFDPDWTARRKER